MSILVLIWMFILVSMFDITNIYIILVLLLVISTY